MNVVVYSLYKIIVVVFIAICVCFKSITPRPTHSVVVVAWSHFPVQLQRHNSFYDRLRLTTTTTTTTTGFQQRRQQRSTTPKMSHSDATFDNDDDNDEKSNDDNDEKSKQSKFIGMDTTTVTTTTTTTTTSYQKYYEVREPNDKTNKVAYPQQTPHSGRHFLPTHPYYNRYDDDFDDDTTNTATKSGRRQWRVLKLIRSVRKRLKNRLQKRYGRFTEGWYYRLTIPPTTALDHDDNGTTTTTTTATMNENCSGDGSSSFAFIISIEDPGRRPQSPLRLAAIQVIGPNDEYIVQGTRDDTLFWAWEYQQGLGCTFQYKYHPESNNTFTQLSERQQQQQQQVTALGREEWYRKVESGFQILPNSLLGKIRGHDGTLKGGIILHDDDDNNNDEAYVTKNCDFDFTIQPICGWGGEESCDQKSTAGWLSSYPVFEPHWQITLADAKATGSVTWKNRTYSFVNASFYAEKNWGAALPKKWYWTQCNTFPGYEQLSVVAGGGTRRIPFGLEETLGMVAVHYNGTLYEANPWFGGMDWDVSTWGYWKLRGNNTFSSVPFEVEVTYEVDPDHDPGLVFRAPTAEEGMVRFCRDTFKAQTVLTLWLLEWNDQSQKFVRKAGRPLIDHAQSCDGGAEIGGGPWWDDWKGEARLKKIFKFVLLLPYRMQNLRKKISAKT